MPKTIKKSSAARQARSSERKRLHNQSVKNRIRSGLRHFSEIVQKNPQEAKKHGCQVISWIDRAAKTRVFHQNAARRYKARLMAQLQKLT